MFNKSGSSYGSVKIVRARSSDAYDRHSLCEPTAAMTAHTSSSLMVFQDREGRWSGSPIPSRGALIFPVDSRREDLFPSLGGQL